MSISMYAITVPPYQQMLASLDFVLEQGAAFVRDKGLDEADVMQRRFAPDMFSLAEQVRQACMQINNAVARLAGIEPPAPQMEPDQDFAAARARVAAAQEFIGSVTPGQLDGDPDRPVDVKTRVAALRYGALEHMVHFANPQVYFHMTTAYDLLRAEGLQVGKLDFLGQGFKDKVAAANKAE